MRLVFLHLVLKSALDAEGEGRHQNGGAQAQSDDQATHGEPIGSALGAIGLLGVVPGVPLFQAHESENQCVQRASREHEAQQRDQHPAQLIVYPQVAGPQYAIGAQEGGYRRQLGNPVVAAEIEPMQAQGTQREREPDSDRFVFHATGSTGGVDEPDPIVFSINTMSSQRSNFQPHAAITPTLS